MSKLVCSFIPIAFVLMPISKPGGCQRQSSIVMGHGKTRETTLAGKWGSDVVQKPPNTLLAHITFWFGIFAIACPYLPAKVVSRVFLWHMCIRRPEKQPAGSSTWNWPNGTVGRKISFFDILKFCINRGYFTRCYNSCTWFLDLSEFWILTILVTPNLGKPWHTQMGPDVRSPLLT